jgi:hypothetical protein
LSADSTVRIRLSPSKLQSAVNIQQRATRIEAAGLQQQDEILQKIKEVCLVALAEVKRGSDEVRL